MASIIVILERDIQEGWQFVQTEAVAAYNFLKPKLESILNTGIAAVEQTLWGAAATLLKQLGGWNGSLADLETIFLNVISRLGGDLIPILQKIGSALIQTLLGVVNVHVTPAAQPA